MIAEASSNGLVPSYDLPSWNRQVLLVRRPSGIPQPEDFALDGAPLEPVPNGRFRVRNLFLSVDPAQRGWASDGTNYAPPVALGSVMRALAAGVVVESRHPSFPDGSYCYGWFGWQDYALAGPEHVLTAFRSPRVPLSAYAGVLGINGLTAHLAFNRIGQPRSGEIVLVSTAAGAVGSVVGQLARASGCEVVGLTGDDAKVARCVGRFGYSRAINYRSGPIDELLATALPDGADIFFDSVGGTMLDASLRVLRPGARVIQCGTASIPSWTTPPTGLRNEREVLTRRLTWGGFVIFDHLAAFDQTVDALIDLIQAGTLTYDEDIREDIALAPEALTDVYAGSNVGKCLVALGATH